MVERSTPLKNVYRFLCLYVLDFLTSSIVSGVCAEFVTCRQVCLYIVLLKGSGVGSIPEKPDFKISQTIQDYLQSVQYAAQISVGWLQM